MALIWVDIEIQILCCREIFFLMEELQSQGTDIEEMMREEVCMAEKAERQRDWMLGSANSQWRQSLGNREEMSSKTGGIFIT